VTEMQKTGKKPQPNATVSERLEPPKLMALDPNRANTALSAAEIRVLKPKDEFQECENCPRMVVVPAGTFVMGSPDGKAPVIGLDGRDKPGSVVAAEEGRWDDEGPQHEVKIARSFAAGKSTVTFDEWEACAKGCGCKGNPWPSDKGWGKGNRPVINVSWKDVHEFIEWLNRNDSAKPYRLLSEAEWEYAARAGSDTRYFWGDEIGKNRANCDGCGSQWDNKQTAPVDSFPANRFGLYDMHGNVWQWVEDCWIDSYKGAPDDGSAKTTGDCSLRVLRGGSWYYRPRYLRAAQRSRGDTGHRSLNVGLRVARTLNP